MHAFALGFTVSLSATPLAQQRTAAVDALFRNLNQPGMPGCALGIVRRGALTLSRSYGLADVENGVRIGVDTRFDLGSMSKQFLALAILILADEGKLALDEDVHRYLPEVPPYPEPVTVHHLLHHTSGLKDYDQLLQLAGWVDGNRKSFEDIWWIIQRQKRLAYRPGTQHSYSDTNYFLLGLIAQRVTKMPLAELLQRLIFRPLGMSHTTLRTNPWTLVPHKAWPYLVQNGKPELYINGEEPLGDGGIFSTVSDLALWERNFETAKVGAARVLEQMVRVEALPDGTANDYAAGLYIRRYRGRRMIEHAGASYGYVAEKLSFPEQRLSIIVLCNRRDAPYVELSNRLADLFLDLGGREELPAPVEAGAELARIGGMYFNEATSDTLVLEAVNRRLVNLVDDAIYRPVAPMTFEFPSSGRLCRCTTTLSFRSEPDGSVQELTATTASATGKPTVLTYKRVRPGRQTASSTDYIGEYVSDDIATSWCLLRNGDSLLVRRRGAADRASQLLLDDVADAPGGFIHFHRTDGQVTGFALRNKRVHAIEFSKLPPGQHPIPEAFSCSS